MNFDVVIIGASTTGLYAGKCLARAGKKVGIFERQKELRPARRTLIVTPLLRKVLGTLPDEVVLHKIEVMAVASAARSNNMSPDQIRSWAESSTADLLAEWANTVNYEILSRINEKIPRIVF